MRGFCSFGVDGHGGGQDEAGHLQRGEEHVLGVHVAVRGLVAEVCGGQDCRAFWVPEDGLLIEDGLLYGPVILGY